MRGQGSRRVVNATLPVNLYLHSDGPVDRPNEGRLQLSRHVCPGKQGPDRIMAQSSHLAHVHSLGVPLASGP